MVAAVTLTVVRMILTITWLQCLLWIKRILWVLRHGSQHPHIRALSSGNMSVYNMSHVNRLPGFWAACSSSLLPQRSNGLQISSFLFFSSERDNGALVWTALVSPEEKLVIGENTKGSLSYVSLSIASLIQTGLAEDREWGGERLFCVHGWT